MNKKEKFIRLIKEQTNVCLDNDKDNIFNKKINVLYTKIERYKQREVLGYLIRHNIIYNEHIKDYYWIYL